MKGMPVQVSTECHKILITSSANELATLAKAIQLYAVSTNTLLVVTIK
jgi:hypothetical protein